MMHALLPLDSKLSSRGAIEGTQKEERSRDGGTRWWAKKITLDLDPDPFEPSR